MKGQTTRTVCLAGAVADLLPIPPITVRPVNVMDEAAFPEMALARKHLASLTPERRAELNEGWTDA